MTCALDCVHDQSFADIDPDANVRVVRALASGLLLVVIAACRSQAPSAAPAAPQAAEGEDASFTGVSGLDAGEPAPDAGTQQFDAGSQQTDAGALQSDAGPRSGIDIDGGWMSACATAPPKVPRSSSPTALLAAPEDPDWIYERPILGSHAITAAWGSSPDDIWAIVDGVERSVAGRTAMAHWDGQGWSIGDPLGHPLHLLWGSGANDVWAGGFGGFLHHFDGSTWTVTQLGMPITAITGTSASDVYVALADWSDSLHGVDVIRHFDGVSWSTLPPSPWKGSALQVQAAARDDLWVLVEGPWIYQPQGPDGGSLYHWDGRSWIDDRDWQYWANAGTLSTGQGVWLITAEKGLQRWNGARWDDLAPPPLGFQPQIFALPGGEAWILPMTGLLLRTDGSCWQTVRDLKPLDEPYGTLQFKRFLFGGTGWIAVADSYGAVYAADQRGWVDRTAEPPVELVALSGTDDDDLWAVGDSGAILHRTAMGWSHVPSRTATSLSGVWAIARNDVWATGGSSPPALLHYDGTAFATAVPPAPWSYSWNFVQATSPTDIWLVGGNFEVSRLSNGVWSSPSAVHPTTSTSGFWASGPADAWRAGSRYWYGSDHSYFTEPLFEHWDGQDWTAVPNPPYVGSMWGLSSRSIWAQSDQGLLHWDGASWNVVSPERLGSVWASADDDVWAITSAGVGRWDGKSWTNTRRLQTPVEYGGAHTLFGTRSGHIWVTGSAGLIARKRSPATKAQ